MISKLAAADERRNWPPDTTFGHGNRPVLPLIAHESKLTAVYGRHNWTVGQTRFRERDFYPLDGSCQFESACVWAFGRERAPLRDGGGQMLFRIYTRISARSTGVPRTAGSVPPRAQEGRWVGDYGGGGVWVLLN